MAPLLIAILVALVAGVAAWRGVLARRGAAAPAKPVDAAAPVAAPLPAPAPALPARPVDPQAAAARASAREKADRVIAAEAARRKAALQKAQNVARAEAEHRAAQAARAAAALAATQPASRLPRPEEAAAAARPATLVGEVTAPGVRPVAAPVAAPVASLPAARKPVAPRAQKSAAQTLVMLVDDSKMVRVKSSRLLAAHGFQVVTAVDGVDALKQVDACCPDLVITDVDMPELDGFGLVNALRANPRTRHIPLVMITSAEDRHREEATRAGVGLVMGKPYDEAALIAHIRGFRFELRAEPAESLACA